MDDTIERLNRLSTDRLIDVVKNYKQYGYDEKIRNTAISILGKRGISEDRLKFTGQFENSTYDLAAGHFEKFNRNSKLAFLFYVLTMVSLFVLPWSISLQKFGMFLGIADLVFGLGYVTFLVKSFLNQHRFYKLVGETENMVGAVSYFWIGMPFYLLMFFHYRNGMKEQMSSIR